MNFINKLWYLFLPFAMIVKLNSTWKNKSHFRIIPKIRLNNNIIDGKEGNRYQSKAWIPKIEIV
jgi:hypothetical protein